MTEFWEDYYTNNPKEVLRDVDKFETGDPIIDRWEEEISKGIIPDLTEGMSDDQKEKVARWASKASDNEIYDIGGSIPETYREEF